MGGVPKIDLLRKGKLIIGEDLIIYKNCIVRECLNFRNSLDISEVLNV